MSEREPGSVFPSTAITWRAGEDRGASPAVETQFGVQGGGDAGDEFPQGGLAGGGPQPESLQRSGGQSGGPLAGGGEAPAPGQGRGHGDEKQP